MNGNVFLLIDNDTLAVASPIQDYSQAHKHKSESSFFHSNNITLPLCLVHIGKAAGSSVSCGLGFTYADCEGMPHDRINHTYYFHIKRNNCINRMFKDTLFQENLQNIKLQVDNQDGVNVTPAATEKHRTQHQASQPVPLQQKKLFTLVVTLRNPITRLQSWYEFEKDIIPSRSNPKEQERIRKQRHFLFKDCYNNTSFNDFVIQGLSHRPTSSSVSNRSKIQDMDCTERAWAAILGYREFSYHEYYNYEHYYKSVFEQMLNVTYKEMGNMEDPLVVPPAAARRQNQQELPFSLYALRTEHLNDDWETITNEPLYRRVNYRLDDGSGRYSQSQKDLSDRLPTAQQQQENNQHDRVINNPLLEGNPPGHPPSSNASSSRNNNGHQKLSPYAIQLLCNALCTEFYYYEKFLYLAENLNPKQIQQSMNELHVDMCNNDAASVAATVAKSENDNDVPCPMEQTPIFPLLKVTKRRYQNEIKKHLFEPTSK